MTRAKRWPASPSEQEAPAGAARPAVNTELLSVRAVATIHSLILSCTRKYLVDKAVRKPPARPEFAERNAVMLCSCRLKLFGPVGRVDIQQEGGSIICFHP